MEQFAGVQHETPVVLHDLPPALTDTSALQRPQPVRGLFRVLVPKPFPGVQYRKSKRLDDKYPRFAEQGSVVEGAVEDEGQWLRTSGHGLLPMRMGDTLIIVPLDAKDPLHAQTPSTPWTLEPGTAAQPDPAQTAVEASKAKAQAANDEIERLIQEQVKQVKFTEQISEQPGSKTEFLAQQVELRAQLDELNAQMHELQEHENSINKAACTQWAEAGELRQQLHQMKKSIGYNSEQEIDERAAIIEHQLCSDTMALKEERTLLDEIQELQRKRPMVNQVHKMEQGLQSFDPGMLMKKISVINEEMAKYLEQKRVVTAKLADITESRKEQLGNLPDIIAKSDELGKAISEKVMERGLLRDDH